MRLVSGTLNGTGAALWVGCGFQPDFVRLWNLESTNPFYAEWNANMRSAEQVGGYTIDNATPARFTESAGIQKYAGGDLISAASTAYLIPTADVLGQLDLSKKGPTITSKVSTWTSDTPASRTGSVNAGVNTTYVGEGSIIRVFDPVTRTTYESKIMVLTNDGDAANEIETSELVPSGEVSFIGPMYDYIGATAGTIMPAGFKIATTGNLNSSGELICFEAGQYL